MRTTYKTRHVSLKTGKGSVIVTIEPGQFIFGRYSVSKDLGESPSTVWDRMKKLAKIGNITIESNDQYSIVSICNWESYQSDDEEIQLPTDHQPTINRPSTDTNKKKKKEEKVKITTKTEKSDLTKVDIAHVDFTNISPLITAETIKQFILHRKVKKSPLTQNALELTCKTAMKCKEAFDLDPNEAIQYGIERGWQSINVKWMEKDFKENKVNGRRQQQQPRMTPRQQYMNDLTETLDEIKNGSTGQNMSTNDGSGRDLVVVPTDALS
jgi:biotin operon repressor